MLLLPLVFRAWNPSEGLQWLPEFSRFGAASGALPVPIHPCAGEAGLGRIPGAAPEGSSGCSHLHPAGFLSQRGWSRIPSVKREREQGKRLVNDLCREEIYTVCRFPPSSFLLLCITRNKRRFPAGLE